MRSTLWTCLILLALGPVAASAQIVRVPADAPTLTAAIGQVPDGGIIEMSGGTYIAPGGGFLFRNLNKSFTVRAASGANVVLSGEGDRPIVRVEQGNAATAPAIFFRGLTLRDGFSDVEGRSGGATVVSGRAFFIDCQFQDNRAEAPTTGGGAARVTDGGNLTFVDTDFLGNSSSNRGGALASVLGGTLYAEGSFFENNRVNLPGHRSGTLGGAIFVQDSVMRISESRFRENQAGFIGGAIAALGTFETPGTDLLISGSTFEDNFIAFDSASPPPGVTLGGAIHLEDQVAMRVFSSRFEANRAEQGGALSSYRAEAEVADSIFRGNLAELQGNASVAVGGAIYATSPDFPDSSTDFGAINRRPASLKVVDSLLQGRFDGTGATANNGGCLQAEGDLNRLFGDLVPQDGTAASNRATVELTRVVFADCDVERTAGGLGGFGGAVQLRLADLEMDDSLFFASDAAADTPGGGGALSAFTFSQVEIATSAFADNSAARGGALYFSGSNIEVTTSAFFENEVSPGVAEPLTQSRGAAIFSIPSSNIADPSRASDMTGVVRDNVFSANLGLPLFEADNATGTINEVRYDRNRIHSTSFGTSVFLNTQADFVGRSVAELNNLVVMRSGGTSSDKSQIPNTSLGTPAREGKVLAVPPRLSRFGETGTATSFLGYAAGGGAPTINNAGVAGPAGLSPRTAAATFVLRSSGTEVDRVTTQAASCSTGGMLCLNGDRFKLDVSWRDFTDRRGIGQAVTLTNDTGYFFFFNPANVELVSKVLDGRGVNGNFWLFYGALSNVEYTLRGLDTGTARLTSFFNPSRNFASVGDTSAFPAGPGSAALPAAATPAVPRSTGLFELEELLAGEVAGRSVAGSCVPSATRLCLGDGRFAVEVDWEDFQGNTGVGEAVTLTDDTGYFFFFNPAKRGADPQGARRATDQRQLLGLLRSAVQRSVRDPGDRHGSRQPAGLLQPAAELRQRRRYRCPSGRVKLTATIR